MKKMFEKCYIGTCQVKNRVVMTAMTTGFAGSNGQPTEQLVRYYEERAKGGVGLIITEIFCINTEHGKAFPNQMNALIPGNMPSLDQMTDRIHKYGTKMFAQIHHGGSTNVPALNGGKLYGADAIPNISGIVPEPLSLAQIEELKGQFIATAVMCKAAGFDGVEIHCAHGYLLCEFLSESSNHRADQYGGSFENRCRLPIEILQGIKTACGKDYPVSVRISADEYDPTHPGSITLKDGVEIAKVLEAAGADCIDVSCCNYFSSWTSIEPYSYEQGWRKENARAIKKAVKVPVIATNTIKEPEFAEKLLEEGICDFVGVGRGNIADPQWVRKAKEGRSADIRKCIGCLYCFENLTGARGQMHCTVNPRAGREVCFAEEPKKDGNGRKIVVIGGGPAGMQAVSLLGKRGFDVTLIEKDSKLGGAMNLADKTAPYKVKITWLRDTLARELEQAGVKLLMNTEATVDTVKALQPEAVFLTGGADPIYPLLPGVDSAKVAQSDDVIAGKVQVSGRVAIIGGGLTGLETAELLSHSGKVDSLVVADMLPAIGTGMYPIIFMDVMNQIGAFPMELMAGHRLEEITESGVKLTKLEDNSTVEVAADYVVLSIGLKPNTVVREAFESAFDRVVVLGENRHAPGRIATSLSEAYMAAYGFDPEV